jgi:peptidoglycan hydrolase-like protein with peptidoglycan-binding domain
MILTTFILIFSVLLSSQIFADTSTERLQTILKAQGFFYGDADGVSSPEMIAALRRYQIRNGLEVTGTINDETRTSLGLEDDKPSPRQKPLSKSAAPIVPDTSEAPRPVAPSLPLALAGSELSQIFLGTPYFTAPREVQVRTLANAQTTLAGLGYYRGTIDGISGPATEEAILIFQGNVRVELSGRLDLSTLAALRLLPVRSGMHSVIPPPTMHRTYRGIWVE